MAIDRVSVIGAGTPGEADALRRSDEQRCPAASDVRARAGRVGTLFAYGDPVRVGAQASAPPRQS
jgi:hypothetical protein